MILITPLKNEDVERLKVGDIVHVSGVIHTARDKAHERALKEGRFPADIHGGVLFHAGPLVKKEKNTWEMVCVGPTTSSRMNGLEPRFIEEFGVRAVIGKGGMDKTVAGAMKGKAVYLAMTGGCAAASAKQVRGVVGVEWLDLGVPEAVWSLEVEGLGPLVVAIDSHGNSLYEDVKEGVGKKLKGLL
ncbi:MAG: fumarate hydratase C-terminal domain-containing protein [Candidatus Altiarchaeota archaeon]|nr:fumarate hydratase C-terminal domain-containing protein [Candidatus Altiarchaeota archaeon]